jgi:hypothetical protein
MSVQIDTAHRRHIDVSDQAGSFDERMDEEIGCRREILDVVAELPYQPSHGFPKVPIILNDRDQCCIRHSFPHSSSPSNHEGELSSNVVPPACEFHNLRK